MREYYVYVMSSKTRRLYVGVTNDLSRRVAEHQQGASEFTSRYNITTLVYYEVIGDVVSAIGREKQIKGWSRSKKLALIESVNERWRDLSVDGR